MDNGTPGGSPQDALDASWPHIAGRASVQPLPGSPLDAAASLTPPPASAHAASATVSAPKTPGARAARPSGKASQAVTFHTRIKSSGYGLTFPKAQLGKAPPKPKKVQMQGRNHRGLLPAHWGTQDMYPSSGWPPCVADATRQVLSDACAAMHVSLDGKRAAVASTTGQFAVLSSDVTG